jgi:hypothetical protein
MDTNSCRWIPYLSPLKGWSCLEPLTEVSMPSYEEVTQRAGSVRAMTGLTAPAFSALLPHFDHAFLAYRAHPTIAGQPGTSRRYSTYDTSP